MFIKMYIASKTFAVIVSLAAIIVSFSLLVPNLQAAGTVVVSGDTAAGYNEPGWLFNRDASTATPFEFNEDEASIGDGSLYVLPIDGGSPSDKFIAEHFLLTPLADVESVSYDFLIGSGGNVSDENEFYMNVYANFGESDPEKFYDCRYSIVPTSGSTATFTTVTFDPTQSYPVTTRGGSSASPHTCPSVPADMDTLSSGSTVRMFALNVGDTNANDAGLDGYYDNVVVETTTETTTYDFEPETAAISGYKFEDVDNDGGFDDNEPQLEGWTIELYENDEFLEATTTNASGEYEFTDLTVGENYVVCEVQQPGWTQTFPDDCHFFEPLTGDEEHINFGNHFAVVPATIAGLKFSDLNNNGDFDDNEPHLEGWTIQLYDDEEELLATTTTDANGEYEFTGLSTGTAYTVCEVQQSGWTQTAPTGNGCYVYDPLAGDVTDAFFGNYLEVVPATISGLKFEDVNNNGGFDDNEPHLEGWTIELYDDEGLLATTTTDANGEYEFTGLSTGTTYTVCEVQQSGWIQTAPTENDGCYVYNPLASDVTDAFFGNHEEYVYNNGIAVLKSYDRNANGIFENNDEPRLGGWTFRLYDGAWSQVGSDEVTPQAWPRVASFDNLEPGDYRVCEVLQDSWSQTYVESHPVAGTFGATVANSSGELDEGATCFEFSIGEDDNLQARFGNVWDGARIIKFLDNNTNGEYDNNGDSRLGDWTFRAYDSTWTEVAEDSTDTAWPKTLEFENLLANETYRFCEVLPEGWHQTGIDTWAFSGQPFLLDYGTEVTNQSAAGDEAELCYEVDRSEYPGSMQIAFGNVTGECALEVVSDTTNMVEKVGKNAVATYDDHPAWTASIPGATWIWNTFHVENPTQDETYTFVKEFPWNGTLLDATLDVASDNSYRAWINGDLVLQDASENNFQLATQDQNSDVTSSIVNGTNEVKVEVTNWAGVIDPESNPAGALYNLTLTGAGNSCENSL